MKRILVLTILASIAPFGTAGAGHAGEIPAANVQSAEPDPAKLAAATNELVAAAAQTDDSIVLPGEDADTSSGWSAWAAVDWLVSLFGWAKMFGLTGGLGLFAVISSLFVGGMVAVGHGMIAVFNVLDCRTTSTVRPSRDRMDAILTRGQPTRG